MSDNEIEKKENCEIIIIKKSKKSKKIKDVENNQESIIDQITSMQLEKSNNYSNVIDKNDQTEIISSDANCEVLLNKNENVNKCENNSTIEEYLDEQRKTGKIKRKKSKSSKSNNADETKIIINDNDNLTEIQNNLSTGNEEIIKPYSNNCSEEKNETNIFDDKSFSYSTQNLDNAIILGKNINESRSNIYEQQMFNELLDERNIIERKIKTSTMDLDPFLVFSMDKNSNKYPIENVKKCNTELYVDNTDSMDTEDLIKSIRAKYNISNNPEKKSRTESESENFKLQAQENDANFNDMRKVSEIVSRSFKFKNLDSDKFIEEIKRAAEAEKTKIKQKNPKNFMKDKHKQPALQINKNERHLAAKSKLEEIDSYIKKLGNEKQENFPVILNENVYSEIKHQPLQIFHKAFVYKTFGSTKFRNSFANKTLRDNQLENREEILNEKLRQVKDLIKNQTEVVGNFNETSSRLNEFDATLKEAKNISQQRIMAFEQLEESFDEICQFYQEESGVAQELINQQKVYKNKQNKWSMDDLLNELAFALKPKNSFMDFEAPKSRQSSVTRFQNEYFDSINSNVCQRKSSRIKNMANSHLFPELTDKNSYISNGKIQKADLNSEFSNETFNADKLMKEYDKILYDDSHFNTEANGNQYKIDDDNFITKIRKKYNLVEDKEHTSPDFRKYFDNDSNINKNIIKFNEELTRTIASKYTYPESNLAFSKTKNNLPVIQENVISYTNLINDSILPIKYNPFKSKEFNYESNSYNYETNKPKNIYSLVSNKKMDNININNYNSVTDISRDVEFQDSLRNLKQFTNELLTDDSTKANQYNNTIVNYSIDEKLCQQFSN